MRNIAWTWKRRHNRSAVVYNEGSLLKACKSKTAEADWSTLHSRRRWFCLEIVRQFEAPAIFTVQTGSCSCSSSCIQHHEDGHEGERRRRTRRRQVKNVIPPSPSPCVCGHECVSSSLFRLLCLALSLCIDGIVFLLRIVLMLCITIILCYILNYVSKAIKQCKQCNNWFKLMNRGRRHPPCQ